MIRSTGSTQLYEEWVGDEYKQAHEYGTTSVIRPLDTSGMYEIPVRGIEKTAVYWPCQLLRALEGYRTGREYLDMGVIDGPTRNELLSIEWFSLQGAVDRSESPEDIAINVAVDVTDTLKSRGLDDAIVASILMRGYDPQPMLEEHGQYEGVSWLWNQIISSLEQLDHNLELVELLRHEVSRRIQLAYEKRSDVD